MDKIGMVEEIKPCPFCGGEASVGKSTYAKDSEIAVLKGQNVFYSVNCHSCNGRRNLIGEKSHKEAIEKWNQRVEVKPATPAPTQPEKCPKCGGIFNLRHDETHDFDWQKCFAYSYEEMVTKLSVIEPTQSWEVGTKFKIVLVCPDRAPDYYAIEYIPNGHRTGFYDNEREANERMDELAWIYAQGQSTAGSQEQLRELQELVSEMFEIFDEDSYGCDCGTNELGTCFFCRGQKVNNEFKDFIKTNALTASPASCHCSGPSPCIHEVKAPASKEASQERGGGMANEVQDALNGRKAD